MAMLLGTGYPTTLGAVDTVFNGGWHFRLSSDGTQLLWSSFLGGSNLDQPYSLDCDENGDLYILGSGPMPQLMIPHLLQGSR